MVVCGREGAVDAGFSRECAGGVCEYRWEFFTVRYALNTLILTRCVYVHALKTLVLTRCVFVHALKTLVLTRCSPPPSRSTVCSYADHHIAGTSKIFIATPDHESPVSIHLYVT